MCEQEIAEADLGGHVLNWKKQAVGLDFNRLLLSVKPHPEIPKQPKEPRVL